MSIFHVSENDRFMLSSTSKGNQMKWVSNNIYLKADMRGCEGFAEALASEFLHFIEFDYSFTDYFVCNIVEDGDTFTGCYSENFLTGEESLLSFNYILKRVELNVEVLYKRYKGIDRLNKVVDVIGEITGLDIYPYIEFIIKFDAIILNEDRHLNNMGVVYNNDTESYRFSPIFDNGLSLLSDLIDYPIEMNIKYAIRKVRAKPFAKDFLKQCSYFSDNLLKVDYDGFIKSLDVNKDCYGNLQYMRSVSILKRQLKDTEGILWERI